MKLKPFRFQKIILLLFLCSTLPKTSLGDDTTKVLFIGNSYTSSNDLPRLVQKIAEASGRSLLADRFLRYGTSLEVIGEDPATQTKIEERDWDYVVLQGGCHNAAYPDSHHIIISFADYRPLPPVLEKLRDITLRHCKTARVIYFMPWAFKDGITWVPGYSDTYADMQKKIRTNAVKFANDLNLVIAPVGWAWYRAIEQRPDIELFSPDWSHACLEGSYLAACVFYATFFQESVDCAYYAGGAPDDSTVPVEKAEFYQQIASATVLEDLQLWRIPYSTTRVEPGTDAPPSEFRLLPNHPNPFNPGTTLIWTQSRTARIDIRIHDVRGRCIRRLARDSFPPGTHRIPWNGCDDSGRETGAGLYFARVIVDDTPLYTLKLMKFK